jgi:hypothetical protein
VKMVFSYKSFNLNEAHVWRSRFPSVNTTIMDQKLQLLKPLNQCELYHVSEPNLPCITFPTSVELVACSLLVHPTPF